MAVLLLSAPVVRAQETAPQQEADTTQQLFRRDAPMMKSSTAPKLYYIRKVNVHGIKYLNHDLIRTSSGLIPGDSLYLPGSYISNAITRLWN